MRKEMLCVLGVLLAACGVRAQQWPGVGDSSAYYQGQVQPVQMAPDAANGGYAPYYYPNNYGYMPSYPPNYGYGSGGYGMNYGSPAGVPPTDGVQVPSDLPATPGDPVVDAATGRPASVGGPGTPNKLFWVSGNYLLASIQRAPLKFPLVTVGSVADPIPGALGQPNTSVAFGANSLGTGLSSGFEAEAGLYLDSERMFSVDLGGFLLFPEQIHSVFASSRLGGTGPRPSCGTHAMRQRRGANSGCRTTSTRLAEWFDSRVAGSELENAFAVQHPLAGHELPSLL